MALEPTVACVMLTKDRPEMAARAVRALRAQTYVNKYLLVAAPSMSTLSGIEAEDSIVAYPQRGQSIGWIRNEANREADDAEIIIHFDDDDVSHPNRIAEQVALLQSSGADCVGCREVLFWRGCGFCDSGRRNILPECPACRAKYDPSRAVPVGKAYLYSKADRRYAIGASLCYWRKVWERRPFPDKNRGEDLEWIQGVRCVGISGLAEFGKGVEVKPTAFTMPRIVCGIHESNAHQYEDSMARSQNFTRVPQWDEYCSKVMQL